ncbi:DNA adenine methylase [Streptomyces sp. ST2-7A]|uniref:DNA adenine methylase n=1 Tax=Streptomyces sp. ST2-7A TaxID=2907214 RepID=UPI001F2AF2CE|nr:DNA adenine methylase [Streptomyces sp. ST2-7A]MCE7083473.1 DNA adenine methylase [Streptomyces sp. ST2-7A]
MPTRPPVPYFGSKAGIAGWIADLLPEHRHYIEPYAGGLSVLLTKKPAPMETVNDLDGELMTFWRVLRDHPDDLARACALTPHSRAEHAAAHEPAPAGDDLETARRVWVRLTQSRGGSLRPTGWRHYVTTSGSATGMPGYLTGYAGRIAATAERLHHVSLECAPALDLITKYGAADDVLLYVDPPYLGTTRTPGTRYRHEMRTPDEHQELATALAGCRAAVVLSGYDSPLYTQLYDGWHRTTCPAITGNGTDRTRTEVLWSNRPLAPAGEMTPELFSHA